MSVAGILLLVFLAAAFIKVDGQERQCTLLQKWSGKFAADTGLVGNLYDPTVIKGLFKANQTFAPIELEATTGQLFLRLFRYAGSTAEYETVKEISYLDGEALITFEKSSDRIGMTTMNQSFILFSFSEACEKISSN